MLAALVSSQPAAAQRSRLDPTPFTHAEFERLTPAARARAINSLTRAQWGRACARSQLSLAALGPKAASWHIACDGSGVIDYMNLETTEEELMHTIFPHPTLSEVMKESVLDAYGKVLNA